MKTLLVRQECQFKQDSCVVRVRNGHGLWQDLVHIIKQGRKTEHDQNVPRALTVDIDIDFFYFFFYFIIYIYIYIYIFGFLHIF